MSVVTANADGKDISTDFDDSIDYFLRGHWTYKARKCLAHKAD